jgi:hypothetical protein
VAASELTSVRRRGSGPRDTWQRRSSPQQGGEVRGCGTRGSAGAQLSKEVRSGVVGHMVAPEPTSAGRFGLKLQLTWQCVDTHPTPYVDLELVCGGIRSSECRQRPPNPPRMRLRTRRWGQFFGASIGYLKLFTLQSTVGPERCRSWRSGSVPPSTLRIRDVDGGPPGGATGMSSSGHHQS